MAGLVAVTVKVWLGSVEPSAWVRMTRSAVPPDRFGIVSIVPPATAVQSVGAVAVPLALEHVSVSGRS